MCRRSVRTRTSIEVDAVRIQPLFIEILFFAEDKAVDVFCRGVLFVKSCFMNNIFEK